SEGTLGVITEATLRLRPRPDALCTLAATFADVVDAGRAVTTIASSIRPAGLELMDGSAIAAVERVKPMDIGPDVGALLIGQSDVGAGEMAVMAAACEKAGATDVHMTDDPDEGELFMGARRMAIPCVERLGSVLIEDVGVPIPEIPALIAGVGKVAEHRATLIPIIGHAGDGNFHPLVTFDAGDPTATERAAIAFDEVIKVALELGGTITGEHGVGMLKASHLGTQLGPVAMELTRTIKRALDPAGILNPDKWT
ncbi:MAG: FAD-binding oxidoreductase, partial [Acidimicrobiales bacterium]